MQPALEQETQMALRVADHLPSDSTQAAQAALTPVTGTMRGSMILGIAGQVRKLQAEGHQIANFTVGDFAPSQFRIPALLGQEIQNKVAAGHTNYPPADGVPELKKAVSDLYKRSLGLDYGPEGVCVGSGARPPIFATWSLFVEPGDRTVSFVPAWNVGYYAHIFQSDHLYVHTSAETNFFPTVEQAREAMRGARLVVLNTPLNPTGTAIDEDVLRGIAQALVEENADRERPCILLFDQVYWMLTSPGVHHSSPVSLVPECAPYVVHTDAVSKSFAGTGLRVGWAVLPPYLQKAMKSLMGHMGSWAPRAEQMAVAAFLEQTADVDAYMAEMNQAIQDRLQRLYLGFQSMKADGLPVDAIEPQGAIYLSLRVNLLDREGFSSNQDVLDLLLEQAGVAVVPFEAFDRKESDGWFRMSVGAVGMDDIDGALARIRAVLAAQL